MGDKIKQILSVVVSILICFIGVALIIAGIVFTVHFIATAPIEAGLILIGLIAAGCLVGFIFWKLFIDNID